MQPALCHAFMQGDIRMCAVHIWVRNTELYEYVGALLQVRTIVSRDFSAALEEYDVLLSPVAATPAYKFGEKTEDPLSMYLGDLMTVNLNMAGLPAVSMNCGFHEEDGLKLPIGMQFIGEHLSEAQLLGVTHAVELTHAPAQTFPE